MLTLATSGMDPESTVLSEGSQTQKATQCVTPFCKTSETGKPTETESGLVVAEEAGGWGVTVEHVMGPPFGVMEMVWNFQRC